MRTKALIARKMNVPADKAWNAISKIGRLEVWFPSIATCTVDGSGIGAHRYMTLERGGDIVDHIVAIDPQKRRLVYERIKSPFPVTSYRGTVEVFESVDSLAVVVWTVDFESTPENSASVASMLEAGIGAGVEGMAADLSA
jgi:hypothetical protein